MGGKNKLRDGFTLIELLVVIGITAVIAAILFPVFTTVRERGRRTTCQSNLKQITLAVQQYVQDNGAYPTASGGHHDNPDGTGAPDCWQHLIFPYIKIRQVFYCPSLPADAPGIAETTGQKDFEEVGYFYNQFSLNRVHRGVVRGVRESEILKPNFTTVVFDECWVAPDGVPHFERDVQASCGQTFGVGTLHQGGDNYSFVDGHVKWYSAEAAGELYCTNPLTSWAE